jgi:hypothetical protein
MEEKGFIEKVDAIAKEVSEMTFKNGESIIIVGHDGENSVLLAKGERVSLASSILAMAAMDEDFEGILTLVRAGMKILPGVREKHL